MKHLGRRNVSRADRVRDSEIHHRRHEITRPFERRKFGILWDTPNERFKSCQQHRRIFLPVGRSFNCGAECDVILPRYMDFHPEAAKRFDELGRELLQLVVPGAADRPPTGNFRPDIHAVANIEEKDIVGGVRVTGSIVNGAQDEIGRVFSAGKSKFGLFDKGYDALTKLTGQIQATSILRESVSVDFVLDSVFNWVAENYGRATVEALSVVVLRKAMEEIREYEIWVPIHQTYLESPISMGDVVFQTITTTMMDVWQAGARVDTKEEDAVARVYFSRERSRLQGCAAASTKVLAEKGKAVEVARHRAGRGAALLRFFSPANWTPKLRSYCVPLGSENLGQSAELFVENGRIVNYQRGALDTRQCGWAFTNAQILQFRLPLEQLNRLAAETRKTGYQEALLDALLLYSRSSIASEPADKIVYLFAALESLLLRNDNEPITKNLGERMAFMCGKDVISRKAIVANASDTYKLRSEFVHHGNAVGDLETLGVFMVNVWTCFYNALFWQDRIREKDQLITALEDRKMA
jgi:hypothetical protein